MRPAGRSLPSSVLDEETLQAVATNYKILKLYSIAQKILIKNSRWTENSRYQCQCFVTTDFTISFNCYSSSTNAFANATPGTKRTWDLISVGSSAFNQNGHLQVTIIINIYKKDL